MEVGHLKIFALNSGKKFAKNVVNHLTQIVEMFEIPTAVHLSNGEEVVFANGEVKYVIHESVRGKDVYFIQLFDDPYSERSINDNIMSLAAAINAAQFSDAQRITAIIPQFPYSRQDKIRGREPLTAKIFGSLLETSGADKIITIDIHAEAIEGYFNQLKMENLHAGRFLLKYIRENIPMDNLIVVAPDIGSSKRGHFFSKKLNLDFAVIDKIRDHSKISKIDTMRLVGDVKGKNVFINDDMIATGSTLINACRLLKEKGAQDIYISVSLPYFNKKAYEKFDEAYSEGLFKTVIGTDAVFWGENFQKDHPWYLELSVAKLFAEVIYSMNQNRSVSRLLE